MVDQVNESQTIATLSMNRLYTIMSRMNNSNRGVNTTQMLNKMGKFRASMNNIEGGIVMQISNMPLIQRMMDRLSDEVYT